MLARVKLKGIDGGPHKRWSMWFNSICEEPYQGLICAGQSVRTGFPVRDLHTGAAWLSSARVVRCWVKSRNERNPHCLLPTGRAGHSDGTAGDKPEEGGDDVKSLWPLCPGLHMCHNGRYSVLRNGDVELIAKSRSLFGLESEICLHEVGIVSNRALVWRGEYVPGPCIYRPSHHPSWGYPKSLA